MTTVASSVGGTPRAVAMAGTANSGGETPRGYLAGDALRGIGALMVFCYHSFYLAELRNPTGGTAGPLWFPFSVLGNVGNTSLILFFSLSAYLLGRPFLASVADRKPLPNVGTYFRNRTLRILPGLWVIFSLVWLRHLLLPDGLKPHIFDPNLLDQGAVYGLFQTVHESPSALLVGQAWSIDVEVQFYLALPAAVFLLWLALRHVDSRTVRLATLAVFLVVVTVGSVLLRESTPPVQSWRRQFPTMAFAFMPGLALALVDVWLVDKRAHGRTLELLANLMPALGVLALVAAIAVDPRLPIFSAAAPLSRPLLATTAAGAALTGPLAWQWAGRKTWAVFDNRPIKWLGDRSYSFYIWHQEVLSEIALATSGVGVALATPIIVAIGLPVTLVLTAITYSLVERPFLNMKGRWRRRA